CAPDAAALARAAKSGFRVSAALRACVWLPGGLQSFAVQALALPGLGPRLVQATRWPSPPA
ncbi:MAG: hypothetical protein ACRD1L_14185, partial [Terriglobales bacterium]